MSRRRESRVVLVPAVAGLTLGVVAAGACGALVATPPEALAACGSVAALLAFVTRGVPRGCVFAYAAIGFGLGISLGREPPAPREAITRAHLIHGVPADMFALLDQLDRAPGAVLGRRVAVTGEWSPASPGRAASVSHRIMACCAADAIRVGFDVLAHESAAPAFAAGDVVCVEGEVQAVLRDGDVRYVIEGALVRSSCRLAHRDHAQRVEHVRGVAGH